MINFISSYKLLKQIDNGWRWCELRKYKFKWRYDRRSANCNLSNCKLTRKNVNIMAFWYSLFQLEMSYFIVLFCLYPRAEFLSHACLTSKD